MEPIEGVATAHGPAPAAGEGTPDFDAAGRPTRDLPATQLVRLSLYWLGLSAVFAGISGILSGRLQFEHLVPAGTEGEALVRMTLLGSVIAMVVQPTVGTLSDYTISRWGRRKPYIVIGSVFDVLFLFGIASSNTILAIAVFMIFLQFSSNFAQGPFQGYVPDLVPAQQVGLASSLVGLFSVLGNVTGFALAALAVYTGQFFLATMALGLVELVTMIGVVLRVSDGRAPRDRAGRSWRSIAGEAWGTDVLQERSFLFLLASRFFVLMGAGVLINLQTFYLAQSLGLDQKATGLAQFAVLAIVVVGNLIAARPRRPDLGSDRTQAGHLRACLLGGIGMTIIAAAPSVPVALVGAAFFGTGSGSFLAVDWALMTDIIPKAESGRYMGMSNVATASSGIFAIAVAGGLVMDRVNDLAGYGAGPRAAILVGVVAYGLGALFLRPVDEHRREDVPAAVVPVPVPAA